MHRAILIAVLLLPAQAGAMEVPERDGFTLELFPSFFEHGSAMGEAINFEWQWF